VKPAVEPKLLDEKTKYFVNATGKFVVGGPQSDTGMTGRKIIVDTYGGRIPHGGGAFSGKDPTKVDRSASYMARYIAKNVVAAGLADKLMMQLAYVIGEADPVSIMVDTFETGKVPNERLLELIKKHFKLTPRGIIEMLDLQKPIYTETSAFGHFGRSQPNFTWEKTDKVEDLKKDA
jgi:S-adenosylmethionine synthetase